MTDTHDSDNDPEPTGVSRRRFLTTGAAGAGVVALAAAFPGAAAAAERPTGSLAVDRLLSRPPFSFTYGGVASGHLLVHWPRHVTAQRLRDGRTVTTVTWTDPATRLGVVWTITEYEGYPTVQWGLRFTNGGGTASKQLADVLAADLDVTSTAAGAWSIHSANGSNQGTTDFGPFEIALDQSTFRLFTTYGGRPTSYAEVPDTNGTFIRNGWPYANVDWGSGGVIVGLGWIGQWGLELARTGARALSIRAGMVQSDTAAAGAHIDALQLTDLWLAPGESISTPTVVVQPWSGGDWIEAQNVWRRWMTDYHLPRDRGGAPRPILSGTEYDFAATAADHLAWLDAYAAHGQTLTTGGRYDHYWIDAGWYESADSTTLGWEQTGTWEVSASRFPDGLNPVVDRARELGMSMILWFEPERVRPGTWLADNHADWLLPAPPGYVDFLGGTSDQLLDFGNPAAQAWAVEHINGLLAQTGVNRGYRDVAPFYREDFNIEPLAIWNHNDPVGRVGITQARYVVGHRDYWQSIRDRNPGMMIDTCGSGGRRLDLDALSLAVPLLRSDLVSPAVTAQCQNYGLALWLPASGNQSPGSSDPADGYTQRSAMTPLWDLPMNVGDPAADWAGLPATVAEWSAIAGLYTGEYRPLTDYATSDDVWLAWQYDAGSRGGFVQAFRRASEPGSGFRRFPLHGLRRAATYELTTYAGTDQVWTASSGFSSTQGANQWHYQERVAGSSTFTDDPTYVSGAWFGSNGTSGNYVAAGSCHPDNTYDAVRTWIAPVAGTISITGSVYKQETGGGNGVDASVLLNDTVLWTRTVAYDDTTGYSTDGDLGAVTVAAGDAVRFVVGARGEYSYDGTIWNPTITMRSDASFSPTRSRVRGATLLNDGLPVTLGPAAAATITYRRV